MSIKMDPRNGLFIPQLRSPYSMTFGNVSQTLFQWLQRTDFYFSLFCMHNTFNDALHYTNFCASPITMLTSYAILIFQSLSLYLTVARSFALIFTVCLCCI